MVVISMSMFVVMSLLVYCGIFVYFNICRKSKTSSVGDDSVNMADV